MSLYSCSIFFDEQIVCISLDEWKNFLERQKCSNEEELKEVSELEEELRLWASYRGQTLTKTGFSSFPLSATFHLSLLIKRCSTSNSVFYRNSVRGMMYYRKALELQAFLDTAEDQGTPFRTHRLLYLSSKICILILTSMLFLLRSNGGLQGGRVELRRKF